MDERRNQGGNTRKEIYRKRSGIFLVSSYLGPFPPFPSAGTEKLGLRLKGKEEKDRDNFLGSNSDRGGGLSLSVWDRMLDLYNTTEKTVGLS
jgi:hypothetical protein